MQDKKEEWVLDFGCMFHITPNRDVLFDLEEFEGGKILMDNNIVSEVKGIGKLKIVNPDQTTVVLTGVRYMSCMVRNLISYGPLEKNGCNYKGEDYKVVFFKKGKKVLPGNYKDGLYYLDGSVVKDEVNVVKQKVNLANL